jgi:hypothetical protein
MVEVGIPSPRPPERGEKGNPPLHFFFLFLSMLSRHFLVSIHHFPMGENPAEPFARVRQTARVPPSCSIPQPADAGNQPGNSGLLFAREISREPGSTPKPARPLAISSHREEQFTSVSLSFLKTMEVHCNRQVLSRRYQFSHPGKNHLHSTERKIKSNPRTRPALSTPPVLNTTVARLVLHQWYDP